MAAFGKFVDQEEWLYKLEYLEKDSPSIKDGLTFREVVLMHETGCAHILHLAMKLVGHRVKARQPAAVAMVYFHRFFAEASFKRHDYRFVAGAALLLSLKLDEVPTRARHVAMEMAECFGFRAVAELGDTASRLKACLLAYERILLSALQFDVTVQLPFGLIHTMSPKPAKDAATSSAGRLAQQRSHGIAKAAADAVRHGAQSVALMVMGSPIALVYRPRAVAVASILASAAIQGLEVVPSFEAEFVRYPDLRKSSHEVLRAVITILTTSHVSPGKPRKVTPVVMAPLPPPPTPGPGPPAAAGGGN